MTDDQDRRDERQQDRDEHAIAALGQVKDSLESLVTSTDKLASKKDLSEDRASRKRTTRLFAAGLVVIIVMLGALGYVALQAREQAQFNGEAAVVAAAQAEKAKKISHQARRTNDILLECTTPSVKKDTHECYEASVAGQQASVGAINAVTMAAVQCIDEPGQQTLPFVRACVRDALQQGR